MKFFIIVFLLSAFASAQVTLMGSLKDQTTGEPVPFAAVYTRAGQGTTSSTEGTFRLTVPHPADTVWVRCLGYRTEVIVAKKVSQPLVIQLVPAAVTTEEVVIVPPRATDILREVSRRQLQNAPDSSYLFDLWFREYLREENVHLMFCEGQSEAMRLPQVGFFHTFSQLNRGRLRPRGESHLDLVNLLLKDIEADTVIDSGQGGFILDDLDFFLNQPKWMNPNHFDHYRYELQTDVVFRGRAAYHITITPLDKDLGRAPRNELWIDAQGFAVMSYFAGVDLSQQTGSSDQLMDGLEGSWKAKAAIWVLLRGLSYQARAYQKRVDYRLTDRGWVLEKAHQFVWVDLKRYGNAYTVIYKQEVVCGPPAFNAKFKRDQNRSQVRPDTGPDTDGFWKRFNEVLPE